MDAPLAVVTGGSRGIGAATCARLARDGYAVDVCFRERADAAAAVVAAIEADGGRAHAVRLDVTDPASVAAYAACLEAAGRSPAVCVNNAGTTADALLVTASPAAWHDVLATNLTGAYLVCQALVPLMLDAGGGSIVNVSSASAALPAPGQAAYAASKAGLEGLTRALAVELRRLHVRVNAVRPGRVRTDMTSPVAARLDAVDPAPWGEPEEIADVIAFLASDAARYVTGQVLTADGGLGVSRERSRR